MDLFNQCNTIVLAVKAPDMKIMCDALTNLKPSTLIISAAAGYRFSNLVKDIETHQPTIRIQTNLAVGLNNNNIYWWEDREHNTHSMSLKELETTLKTIFPRNKMIKLEKEEDLELITVLSGCLPAFITEIVEEMDKYSQEYGLSKRIIKQALIQSVIDTGFLLEEYSFNYNDPYQKLKGHIATRGGGTEKGLMEAKDMKPIIKRMIKATHQHFSK